MSNIQTRAPKGTPAGGRFTTGTHAEPGTALTGPQGRHPHPDANYPHPMSSWPEGVEEPSSITLGAETLHTGTDDVPQPGPMDEIWTEQPKVTVTMANGATLTLQHTSAGDDPMQEETFDGDWDSYLHGDRDAADAGP
ncbi:hypothetical protein [Arthrobacter sp. H14]|uniref:hypothetical protein n=1 Tax=Arthrobacter sp. H14 TaxID=1312959 RepID=UPI0004789680|nr:hypothetical protein [Arthrobacter sp. H14]